MNLDIHDAVVMAVILAAGGAIFSLWAGVRSIRRGRKVAYYRMARKQIAAGLRTLLFAAVLIGFAVVVGVYAEPAAYNYFPPSPTQSLTPTITLTPTISLTPTITETPTMTLTPAESYTPTITLTPFVPDTIQAMFTSSVTPDPEAVFSPITFSTSVNMNTFQAVDPKRLFEQPIEKVYATYSYNFMNNGVDWTALWYRNGELLSYETSPWEGGTGGSGIYTLTLPGNEWLEGTYQLIFFVGTEWKVLGEFLVRGDPPTPTFTPTTSGTASPTLTLTATRTYRPTFTPKPTDTRWPTDTK
jgi:type VI secretion system secreted protein VgrG